MYTANFDKCVIITLFYCVADTTDVQMITAVVTEDYDSTLTITILCDFITGSNAQLRLYGGACE